MNKERLLHHVVIIVFCKPYDDPKRVLAGLDLLSPVATGILLAQEPKQDPQRPQTHYKTQDATLTMEDTETDSGTMRIYTLHYKKMSAVNALARNVFAAFGVRERKSLRADPGQLLDHEGRLSLRLDKELLMDGRIAHTASGNCYQVKASVAAYPNNRERAISVLQRLFEE